MHKLTCTVLALLLVPASASAWGEKGHLMINRLAIDAGTASLPEFMAAGRNQLIYNGYRPVCVHGKGRRKENAAD